MKKINILLLTFYYPPDLGPAPLRAHSMVGSLLKQSSGDVNIDVITTTPNRYTSMAVEDDVNDFREKVQIKRIRLPSHNGGMIDQSKAFAFFAWQVLKTVRNSEYDIVVASSSRLMTAFLASLIARQKGSSLYLDIRDLFTDTIGDILHPKIGIFLHPILGFLEQVTFRSADKINVVSPGFVNHVKKVAPGAKISVYTNGVDTVFHTVKNKKRADGAKPLFLYAGNIGACQGLHEILPSVIQKAGGSIKFKLIGDGARRAELEKRIGKFDPSHFEIVDPLPRKNLIAHYSEADFLFLHLNSQHAFRKVLPSKIFEYAATGKPILAGVAGEARDFLAKNVDGVEVFDPCSSEDMMRAIVAILKSNRKVNRQKFCQRYEREKIMTDVAKSILELFKERPSSEVEASLT